MQQKNDERILFLLKTKGPQTANTLATMLEMTSMGARQHLQNLQKELLVESFQQSVGVGRPKKSWRLTGKADNYFPETHAYMTIGLIDSIQKTFGKNGLKKIISQRDEKIFADYQSKLKNCKALRGKLAQLTQIRNAEGYMAEYEDCGDGSYLFIENHCPICAAATKCQQFCLSELRLFNNLFAKDDVVFKRESHIISGARRCAYRVMRLENS